MKILTIATSFPYPPDDGTKIQVYERIRGLCERHEVTLVCASTESISAERIEEMNKYCACICIDRPRLKHPSSTIEKLYQLVRSIAIRTPYYIHDRVGAKTKEWVSNYTAINRHDIVEADADAHLFLCATAAPIKVAIFHSVADVCAEKEIQLATSAGEKLIRRIYKTLTRSYERDITGVADLCVVLTESNRRELQLLHPSARVRHCLSNGVDLEYFADEHESTAPQGVCFVGKMDYPPNVDAVLWFAHSVLPRVRQQLPSFRFVVVGGHPTHAVRALAHDPLNTITGYVDDVRPHMREAGLSVLPMRLGGGILNKLLQAMAMGIPTLATSHALDGLAIAPERIVMVSDSEEDMAEKIVKLATDPVLRGRLALAARSYVETSHQWQTMVQRYEKELQQCRSEVEAQGRVGRSELTRA